jgi:hypothetical protein
MVGLRSHPAINQAMAGERKTAGRPGKNPLSSYETVMPHKTQPDISGFERTLLKAYLDNPQDVQLAKFLAIHHLSKAVLYDRVRRGGKSLEHTLIAQYFLHRASDLGARERWIREALKKSQRELDALFTRRGPISLYEDRPAHKYFRETFHHREENRYVTSEVLLDEFVNRPRNVYTAFTINALHLWVGGEADYADPTAVYNFAVGSYFSIYSLKLARELEEAWDKDPAHNTRFRLATILGGFSALHRRWLAKLHGDNNAVQLIDDEHRLWRIVHPAFHAFTLGLPFFEESEHFQEGKAAFEDAVVYCQQVPVRTCSDYPRFSYNFMAFILGYVDFLLKNGDLDAATQYLGVRQMPQLAEMFTYWDIGKGPYQHRENNGPAISALYRNGDAQDDPLNFLVKKKRWGMNTTTCQVCHQTQGKVWTKEEMAAIQLPPEAAASVRTWPPITTSWYGAALPQ